jgi:hypothetical protein
VEFRYGEIAGVSATDGCSGRPNETSSSAPFNIAGTSTGALKDLVASSSDGNHWALASLVRPQIYGSCFAPSTANALLQI